MNCNSFCEICAKKSRAQRGMISWQEAKSANDGNDTGSVHQGSTAEFVKPLGEVMRLCPTKGIVCKNGSEKAKKQKKADKGERPAKVKL